MKYPKIETLYNRDKETFKVDPVHLRCPEFGLISYWLITEKIDGTNVRILRMADGTMDIRGRTDNADWAKRDSPLRKRLAEMFPIELLNQVFDPGAEVILYGEGYGAGIQKGGVYRSDPSFRLFDIKIGDWWLNWDEAEDFARKLSVDTVPALWLKWEGLPTCEAELDDMAGISTVARMENEQDVRPEGIVARTDPLLITRYGQRVMWKLKFKDF